MKLKPETLQKIALFKSKHAQLSKELSELSTLKPLQFSNYSIQNRKVLEEAKISLEKFEPKKLDLKGVLGEIERVKQQELKLAQKTLDSIKKEQLELKELLVNIENARPIDQLTVDDVQLAYPELDKTVSKMVKRGQWRVPGYYEKFGEFSIGF